MVIFLSNFLALLIKVDATGESNKNILGGIMVAVNVLLVAAVLFATGFATQQSVQDHRDGETPFGVAATMLTFERRVSAGAPPAREEELVAGSGSSPAAAGAPLPAGRTRSDRGTSDAASTNNLPAAGQAGNRVGRATTAVETTDAHAVDGNRETSGDSVS